MLDGPHQGQRKQDYFQIGAQEVNPSEWQDGQHGFDFGTRHATGVTIPVELGYQPGTTGAYPGHYKIGTIYDSSPYPDPYFDVNGAAAVLSGLPSQTHHGRVALYGLFDQTFFKPDSGSQRGLTIFGGYAKGTTSSQLLNNQPFEGFSYVGPLAGRPNDSLNFPVNDFKISGREVAFLNAARRTLGGTDHAPSHEVHVELNYGIQVRSGLVLQPDLQYIVHPTQFFAPTGTNIPNVFVIGVKVSLNLTGLAGIPPRHYHH